MCVVLQLWLHGVSMAQGRRIGSQRRLPSVNAVRDLASNFCLNAGDIKDATDAYTDM